MAIYERLFHPGAEYHYTDYTSFESHFKEIIQESIEQRLYLYMTKNLPATRLVVSRFLDIKAGDQNLSFKMFICKLVAFRCSGEMDTSLGNGFSNLMLWLYASYLKGCPEEKISGFFEGDDGLCRNDGPAPTKELFADLGFTIKVEKTKRLSEASFCGQVYDIEDLAVVTDVREQVCRVGWTNKKYVLAGDEVRNELLRARGYSLLYQYTNCPVLGPLGAKIIEMTSGIRVRQSIIDQLDSWERDKYYEAVSWLMSHRLPVPKIGENTRCLVERLYGITVLEQLTIEKSISTMSWGPLPFQFFDVPSDWINYFDRFVVDDLRLAPFWIPSDDRRVYNNLLSAGVPLDRDYTSLRGVG
jgi:hypothetical protein